MRFKVIGIWISSWSHVNTIMTGFELPTALMVIYFFDALTPLLIAVL